MTVLTEEQAKTRWCPFARTYAIVDDAQAVTVNRWRKKPEDDCFCIASDCMAWRWVRILNPDWKPEDQSTFQVPPRDRRNDPPMYVEDTTRGYCGLAGRGEV